MRWRMWLICVLCGAAWGLTGCDSSRATTTPDASEVDPDRDGDGILDEHEGVGDTDGDGVPDADDLDSDDDGILDAEEAGDADLESAPVDSDSDGIADFRDSDSDNNGIDDSDELTGDTDQDGEVDRVDRDDDNDGLLDAEELAEAGPDRDSDGDRIPDWRDPDRDNDTILDGFEREGDTDGDGIDDILDTDSDADTISDREEAGDDDPFTPPQDTDGDQIPDFRDPDSDNDGLSDLDEVNSGTSAVDDDSDGDGVSDLIEVAAGTDALGPLDNPRTRGDFVFVVPYEESPEPARDTLEFSTNIQLADVYFLFDTTMSMDDEISEMRASVAEVIGGLACEDFGTPCATPSDCGADQVCGIEGRCIGDPQTAGCVASLWTGVGRYAGEHNSYRNLAELQPDAQVTQMSIPSRPTASEQESHSLKVSRAPPIRRRAMPFATLRPTELVARSFGTMRCGFWWRSRTNGMGAVAVRSGRQSRPLRIL